MTLENRVIEIIEHQKEKERKQAEYERREQYIQDVRVNMEVKMQQRLEAIEKKRNDKDVKISQVMDRRKRDMML